MLGWRQILCCEKVPLYLHTSLHSIHNIQNSTEADNFVDCVDTGGIASQNKSSVTKKYGNMTELDLKEFLSTDWDDYKDNPEALLAWAELLATSKLIEQGKVPAHYTAITHCAHCGELLLCMMLE